MNYFKRKKLEKTAKEALPKIGMAVANLAGLGLIFNEHLKRRNAESKARTAEWKLKKASKLANHCIEDEDVFLAEDKVTKDMLDLIYQEEYGE